MHARLYVLLFCSLALCSSRTTWGTAGWWSTGRCLAAEGSRCEAVHGAVVGAGPHQSWLMCSSNQLSSNW